MKRGLSGWSAVLAACTLLLQDLPGVLWRKVMKGLKLRSESGFGLLNVTGVDFFFDV